MTLTYCYLVEAPFQLIAALEYKNSQQRAVKHKLLIRSSANPLNLKQMNQLLNLEDWDEVIYIDGLNFAMSLISFLRIKMKAWVSREKFERILIGDYKSKLIRIFLRFFPTGHISILDDGVASISLLEIKKSGLEFSLSTETSKGLGKLLLRSRLEIVSFLPLPEHDQLNIIRWEFDTLKNRFENKLSEIDTSLIYLLGVKYVELGELSESGYSTLIGNIVKLFPGKNVVYLGHRGEDSGKLERLKEAHCIEVVLQKMPFELELLTAARIPEAIVSLNSAVLYTSKALKPEIKVVSILLDSALFSSSEKAILDICYKYQECFMPDFQFVEFDKNFKTTQRYPLNSG